jgi:hypothetical protein
MLSVNMVYFWHTWTNIKIPWSTINQKKNPVKCKVFFRKMHSLILSCYQEHSPHLTDITILIYLPRAKLGFNLITRYKMPSREWQKNQYHLCRNHKSDYSCMIIAARNSSIASGHKNQHHVSAVSPNVDKLFSSQILYSQLFIYWNSFLNLSAAEAALLLVGSSTRAYLKSVCQIFH